MNRPLIVLMQGRIAMRPYREGLENMVIWLIGLSGAGKTTLAQEVVRLARAKVDNLVYLDGDVIRDLFSNDLGYTLDDRRKNADRMSRLSGFLDSQGVHVVCAILSIFPEHREWMRANVKNYYEVFIDAPLEDLVQRDGKKLYARALKGEIKDVAGVDLKFIPPSNPDLVIRNDKTDKELLSHAPALVNVLLSTKKA